MSYKFVTQNASTIARIAAVHQAAGEYAPSNIAYALFAWAVQIGAPGGALYTETDFWDFWDLQDDEFYADVCATDIYYNICHCSIGEAHVSIPAPLLTQEAVEQAWVRLEPPLRHERESVALPHSCAEEWSAIIAGCDEAFLDAACAFALRQAVGMA